MSNHNSEITCVYWPPLSHVRAFERPCLSDLASKLVYEIVFALTSSLSNSEYTRQKIVTSTKKVVDPSLSRNVDLNN